MHLPESEITELAEYVKSARRRLHALAELSDNEYKTSAFLKQRLDELGLSYKCVHTGLYADIEGKNSDGKMVALRCDMDALPIKEKNDIDFKAEENMHACGHDGHMAMVLGAAKLLVKHKPDFDVRLIFQFGEEGDGGADKMIKAGVLDGVDEIFAFHLNPEIEKGAVASLCGAMFAGAVEFDIIVEGKASHCADRQKGNDAAAAVRDILNAVSELGIKYERELLHVGRINAGSARNIVADFAEINCTLRYFRSSVPELILKELTDSLNQTDRRHGTVSRTKIKSVYPPLVNSDLALDRFKSVTKIISCEPKFTAEDFAFYTRKINGCMAWLGTRDEKYFSPLHSDTFGFDESVLEKGAEILFSLCFERQ